MDITLLKALIWGELKPNRKKESFLKKKLARPEGRRFYLKSFPGKVRGKNLFFFDPFSDKPEKNFRKALTTVSDSALMKGFDLEVVL